MPAHTIYRATDCPDTAVIIPSTDGSRGGNVSRLVEQLKSQSHSNIEIIIAVGERPNGKSRNVGVTKVSTSVQNLAFFDDDVKLGSSTVLENLIVPLKDPTIGLVGASQLPPEGSCWFQRWLAYDLAKASFPIQSSFVETEMVTHAGMACRKTHWTELEGESDILVTGTDTDLRQRTRNAKRRVVVAPYTWVYHPLPAQIKTVLRAAIYHGYHQYDFRLLHGFQKRWYQPFQEINSTFKLLQCAARELLFFAPHIIVANRSPKIGFRPINALFRALMVASYSKRCLDASREKRNHSDIRY